MTYIKEMRHVIEFMAQAGGAGQMAVVPEGFPKTTDMAAESSLPNIFNTPYCQEHRKSIAATSPSSRQMGQPGGPHDTDNETAV